MVPHTLGEEAEARKGEEEEEAKDEGGGEERDGQHANADHEKRAVEDLSGGGGAT